MSYPSLIIKPPQLLAAIKAQAVVDVHHACVCPFCSRGLLRAYPEQITGHWWSCDRCRTCGTSVSIYQKLRGLQDPIQAAVNLFKEATGPHDDGEFPPLGDSFRSGCMDDDANLKVLNEFWTRSCRRLQVFRPERTLQQLVGRRLNGFKEIANLETVVGSVDRQDLEMLENVTGGKKFESSLQDRMVLQGEAAPGRPCCFHFLSPDRPPTNRGYGDDAGVIGLAEACSASPETCFVVIDPWLYLSLRRRWNVDSSGPVPLVCLVDERINPVIRGVTGSSLECLHHGQIIFWDAYPEAAVRHARKLGDRGMVVDDIPNTLQQAIHAAESKQEPLDRTIVTNGRSATELMRYWSRHAVPWLEIVRRRLCNLTCEDTRIVLAECGGPLTHDERSMLRNICTADQWRRIKLVLDDEQRPTYFSYQGHGYVDRPGRGWFRQSSNRRGAIEENLVCDATIRLDQAVLCNDDVYLMGRVRFQDQIIPFYEQESVIRMNTANWLVRVCMAGSSRYPFIDTRIRNSLLNMAQAIHNPPAVRLSSRVGFDPASKCFWLPQFTVANSIVSPINASDKSASPPDPLPGMTFLPVSRPPPAQELVDHFVADNASRPARQLALTLFCLAMANLTAIPRNRPLQTVVAINPSPAARLTMDLLAARMGLMVPLDVADPDRWDIESLCRASGTHCLPAYLPVRSFDLASWRDWAHGGQTSNVMLGAELQDALNLSINGGSWTFVTGCSQIEIPIDPSDIGFFDAMVGPYLSYLTSGASTIPNLARWPTDVFRETAAVWFDPSRETVKSLIRNLEAGAVTPDPDRADQRVLLAIHHETTLGRIAFGGIDGIVKADTGSGRVRIAISGILRHMKRYGWIFPERTPFEEIFRRSPNGHRVESRWISVDAGVFDAAGNVYKAIASGSC